MSFPKVLIVGQPFNDFSGGGITLSNLFRGWPKDKISVAFIGHGLFSVTTDICDTYYQLGKEEHKWIFPFNLMQRKFVSGLKTFDKSNILPVNFIQTGLRYKLVNWVFYPFLEWIGLFHMASKIHVSEMLKGWLSEFKPELLYLQVSNREEILFSTELIDVLKIPTVIHMMDDWPSTISRKGLLKNFWNRKMDSEFRKLLDKVDLFLSISDAMSEEYEKRYNKKFIPFHNPIETETWLKFSKTDFSMSDGKITVLYSGRIGIGIKDSLIEAASAIDSLAKDGVNIKMHIQTPTKKQWILDQLQQFSCVVINPIVPYNKLPEIFPEADILLLANDFSEEGMDFLRFSMPTKASEYMISGTPILVYAPEGAAVTKFFRKNDCGYCITDHGSENIKTAIKYLIDNEEYRRKISFNAVELARERFSSVKVRQEFQGVLSNVKIEKR